MPHNLHSMNNKILQKNNKQKGFTLLFAVLISTLVLSISATVTSIALRQTIISTTGRESQYAFYAANTAMECAFYWDVIGHKDTNQSDKVVFPAPGQTRVSDGTDINCAGGNITNGDGFDYNNQEWNTNTSGQTTFYIDVHDAFNIKDDSRTSKFNHHYCAQATVKKQINSSTGIITTTIEAKGYNTCDPNNSRRVERGLIQVYQS